jgi:hypothetical protein
MARRGTLGGWGLSGLFYVAAVVIFVLAALDVDLGGFDRFDLVALGLASFAAAHVA